MKNLILITLSLLITINIAGQTIENESRKIGAFDKISVNSVIKVELYKSTSTELEIYTENVPTEKIKSNIKNGKLILDLETRRKGWNDIEIKIRVPFQNLTEINGHTASHISSNEILKIADLEISLGEASRCKLNVNCDYLEVNLNSASNLELKGICEKLDADINSAATLNAFELNTVEADIVANSMGKAKVNVKKDLHISAGSMAKVYYMGEPSKLHKDKSSMASIKQVSEGLQKIK